MHECPVCLRKLELAIGFDHIARYRLLHDFYSEHATVFPDETDWTQRRLEHITGATTTSP